MAEELENELFLRYKETGDTALRNAIAEKYLYIAEIIAKKFANRGVEYDDLKQVAALALVRGIDRFDPAMGMQFSTFITPTIAGEIKNYFRDKSRMVKLPRRLGEISLTIKKFAADYAAKEGVKPSVRKIAEALSLSEEEVVQALEIGGTVSLDSMAADSEGESDRSLYALLANDEDKYENFETKETLKAALRDFSDTEKALVKFRYMDELSQSETAKRLGVSQMFVSRMERKVLENLREKLKDAF
jgi:RNA polymerase sigma-B factor